MNRENQLLATNELADAQDFREITGRLRGI